MEIKLEHPFLYNCHNMDYLLDVNKFSSFCRKLEEQSIMSEFYPSEKYKGDGFEFFVEGLIKLSPVDNRIGINHYKINLDGEYDDYGVDGSGLGIDLNPAATQVKYRGDHRSFLMYNNDHLANFTSQAWGDFKVNPDSKTNLLIVTTAFGIHYTVNTILREKIRCIGYEDIRNLVDNMPSFWKIFKELVESSR